MQKQQQPHQPQNGNGNGGPIIETRWHYLGPDNEAYGPYTAKDMMFWLTSGYFNETLQLRTENESSYHTLGEWTSLLGNHPFGMPVHSLEATMAQMNTMRPPHGPMMIMPPGLQNPFPPPMQMRFPPFLPMPLLHQMGPNGPPMGAPMLTSQPPSEPIDAGSLSHTPDSEDAARESLQQPAPWLVALGLAGQHGVRKPLHHQHQQMMQQHIAQPLMAPMQPQQHHVQVATDVIVTKDVSCQTEPMKLELSKVKAARLLTELFGQLVVIN